jgi:predicted nucleic acid-binding protein
MIRVIFDTNIYISYIRNGAHKEEVEQRGTVKHLAATVLLELWAGARTKQAKKLLGGLLKPYTTRDRIVVLGPAHYASMGRFFAGLPAEYVSLAKHAGFVNDVHVAHEALSIGATLFTEDRHHFEIIAERLPSLKVKFL